MNVDDNKSSLFDLGRLKGLGGYKAGDLLAVDPQLYEKFMKHLNKTVKRDVVTKNMDLLTCLSAYTSQPLNLFLRGESSTGKTYGIMQVSNYFPKEDVWTLGGLSKRALVHGFGILVDQHNEEIDLSKKPDKPKKGEYANDYDYREAIKEYKEAQETWLKRLQNSRYLVDLSGKILLFLEPPDFETFMALRPILSHDAKEISYKIVDKTGKGKLQTKHVIIRGWPACVFCSTREKYVQDLATRGFTTAPETTVEKYREANVLTAEKAALPWKFQRDFDFELLEGYVRSFKNRMEDYEVLIPYAKQLAKKFPSNFPRSMRDFQHILTLIKVFAQFHFAQRPVLVQKVEEKEQYYVMAVREDYEFVMVLWEKIRETTETSAPGQIMRFFHEVVKPLSEKMATIHVEDLVNEWNSKFEDKRSSDIIRKWIDFLAQIGYVSKQPDMVDKRRYILTVIKENQKNGNYTQNSFSEFFGLDSFKAWLNEAKKYKRKTDVVLKEKIFSDVEMSPEAIFEKFFLNTSSKILLYFPSDSKASLSESGKEKTENQKSVQFPNFEKLERLGPGFNDKCVMCGTEGPMDYQITRHDGTWGFLCGTCGINLIQQKQVEVG